MLGALSETSLDDGLAATWAWAREIGPSETPAFPAIELKKGYRRAGRTSPQIPKLAIVVSDG